MDFNKNLNDLLARFKIKSVNQKLYQEAFTHVSYSQQHHLNYSYERLEFLGDAIIDKVIGEFLYKHFPNDTPKELSQKYTLMSNGKTLFYVAKRLGFEKLLILGSNVINTKSVPDRIYEDAFEAFIGAIYIDCGEKKVFDILQQTVMQLYFSDALRKYSDYKSQVLAFGNKNKIEVKFNSVRQQNRIYRTELFVDSKKVAIGEGSKAIDAENMASKKFLSKQKDIA